VRERRERERWRKKRERIDEKVEREIKEEGMKIMESEKRRGKRRGNREIKGRDKMGVGKGRERE
jgi:hypothetical protein